MEASGLPCGKFNALYLKRIVSTQSQSRVVEKTVGTVCNKAFLFAVLSLFTYMNVNEHLLLDDFDFMLDNLEPNLQLPEYGVLAMITAQRKDGSNQPLNPSCVNLDNLGKSRQLTWNNIIGGSRYLQMAYKMFSTGCFLITMEDVLLISPQIELLLTICVMFWRLTFLMITRSPSKYTGVLYVAADTTMRVDIEMITQIELYSFVATWHMELPLNLWEPMKLQWFPPHSKCNKNPNFHLRRTINCRSKHCVTISAEPLSF